MLGLVLSSLLLTATPTDDRVERQSERAQIEIYEANGEPIAGFSVAAPPSGPRDLTPRTMTRFRQDVRGTDNKWVRGLGFRAWPEGKGVRILVVLLIPKNQASKTTPILRARDFDFAVLANFSLALGDEKTLEEMRPLGLAPQKVRVFPAGAHAH